MWVACKPPEGEAAPPTLEAAPPTLEAAPPTLLDRLVAAGSINLYTVSDPNRSRVGTISFHTDGSFQIKELVNLAVLLETNKRIGKQSIDEIAKDAQGDYSNLRVSPVVYAVPNDKNVYDFTNQELTMQLVMIQKAPANRLIGSDYVLLYTLHITGQTIDLKRELFSDPNQLRGNADTYDQAEQFGNRMDNLTKSSRIYKRTGSF